MSNLGLGVRRNHVMSALACDLSDSLFLQLRPRIVREDLPQELTRFVLGMLVVVLRGVGEHVEARQWKIFLGARCHGCSHNRFLVGETNQRWLNSLPGLEESG